MMSLSVRRRADRFAGSSNSVASYDSGFRRCHRTRCEDRPSCFAAGHWVASSTHWQMLFRYPPSFICSWFQFAWRWRQSSGAFGGRASHLCPSPARTTAAAPSCSQSTSAHTLSAISWTFDSLIVRSVERNSAIGDDRGQSMWFSLCGSHWVRRFSFCSCNCYRKD